MLLVRLKQPDHAGGSVNPKGSWQVEPLRMTQDREFPFDYRAHVTKRPSTSCPHRFQ